MPTPGEVDPRPAAGRGMRPRDRSRLCLMSVLALHLASGHALAGSLETLMADLAKVETRQARFVEERTLGILDETLVTEGTLTYQAPDRLIRQDLLPDPALYAIDGDELKIVVDGKERVVALDQEPLLQAMITPFRALFAGDLTALQSLFEPAYKENGERWTVTLTPKASSPTRPFLDRIEITGQDQEVLRMDAFEQGGDHSSMRLSASAGR